MAGLDQHIVATFLSANENRHFVRNWFRENVSSATLTEWLIEAEQKQTLEEDDDDDEEEEVELLDIPHDLNNAKSGSFRKIMFQDFIDGKKQSQLKTRRLSELKQLSEMEMLMELIRDVANELDVDTLCHKILINVSILTQSDRGSLFLVRGSGNKKHLVSKLFDVTENSKLEDNLHTESNQIRVPMGKGIAGKVALTKETINIRDAYEDDRFNSEVDTLTGYHTKSILCMPIVNYDGEVVGVAQIMNKKNADNPEFTPKDEEVFKNYLTFCGIGLTNAQLFEMSVEEYKRNELLLNLARGLFTEQQNLDKLIERIMLEAQELLHFQRCTVYLNEETSTSNALTAENQTVLDETMFNKIFQLKIGKDGAKGNVKNLSIDDLEGSGSLKNAVHVANTKDMFKVADTSASSNTEMLKDYDGYFVRSLVCIPIMNEYNRCVGVFQLMNKISGKPFTTTDVNILQAFVIFCGLGIHNCQLYESTSLMMAKQKVAFDVLSFHASASMEEAQELLNTDLPDPVTIRLFEYDFNDFELTDIETCAATIQMFEYSKMRSIFKIPNLVLCRWILSVKRNYRPVTYHNWRHAFNVAQTMYTMIYTSMMKRLLSNLEIFSLLVACLCHDLDHRGTNNTFQASIDSPIAKMYSTSIMEHHHFDQCVMILNGEGNNIFTNLTSEQYHDALKMVESTIISTDLALYFQKKGTFLEMVATNETDWLEPNNKNILRSMMMTACDVAGITKPWELQVEIAALVSAEFFEQGDLERDLLNKDPMAMMDRRQKELLPKMQIGFINFICLPLYKALADFEPLLSPLLHGVENNRNEWQKLADKHDAEIAAQKEKEEQQQKEEEKAAAAKATDKKGADKNETKSEKKETVKKVEKDEKPAKSEKESKAVQVSPAGPSDEAKSSKPDQDSQKMAKFRANMKDKKERLQATCTQICSIL